MSQYEEYKHEDSGDKIASNLTNFYKDLIYFCAKVWEFIQEILGVAETVKEANIFGGIGE